MDQARYAEVLRRLAANEVEFIVVGMMAGVLRGAPVLTVDLDRHDARRLRPGESHLLSAGHQLLTTTHGDLDCLGAVGEGRTYEDLLTHASPLSLGEGLSVQVIDLPTLIELKEQAARPKDLAVLPVLRATLAETLRRS